MRVDLGLLLINSFIIWGIYFSTSPGQIFSSAAEWVEARIDVKYWWTIKPLWLCPPCMSSVHGAWFIWLVDMSLPDSLLHIIALVGLNYIISQLTITHELPE